MEYFTAYWYHSFDNEEPRIFYSEIDHNRYEIRKVEVYDDNSFGMAGDDFSFGGAELGEKPVPQLEEINGDTEFKADAITAEEFEAVWTKYINYLKR